MQAPAEPATGSRNDFSRTPFPPKVPQNGGRAIFSSIATKMPILFHSGNKRQFKLCPQSVSNYQNQLVEAENLFKKKSHFCLIPLYVAIFAIAGAMES